MEKFFLTLLFSFVSLFAFEHLDNKNIDDKIKGKNVIIDFYATWCPPCKVLAKNLIKFDKIKPSNVVIYKIDIDKEMDLAKKYNVKSLPTLVYLKDGKVVAKKIGVSSVDNLVTHSMKYFK
jgi:thioredoxin 1